MVVIIFFSDFFVTRSFNLCSVLYEYFFIRAVNLSESLIKDAQYPFSYSIKRMNKKTIFIIKIAFPGVSMKYLVSLYDMFFIII